MINVNQIHNVLYFNNTSLSPGVRGVDVTGDIVVMVPVVTVVSKVVLVNTVASLEVYF